MSSQAVPILVMAGAFALLVVLLRLSSTADFAGPVRMWFWRRDARRWARAHQFPHELRRAYWSRREYDRDSQALRALGYRIRSEEAVDPFITLPPMPSFGRTTPRPRQRRVPCIYVDYSYQGASIDATSAVH